MRETKLVTKVKETDAGDDKIKERQQMVSTMKPGELAAMRGLSDFPVPTLFKRNRSGSAGKKDKEEKRSASRAESLPRSLSGTLPRSWKDKKCLTKVVSPKLFRNA